MADDWSRRRLLTAAGTLAAAGCAAVPDLRSSPGDTSQSPGSASSPAAGTATPTETPASGPYARVYRATVDSVVRVRVHGSRGRTGGGTGFVYDGTHFLTNHHVVDGADAIELGFSEGAWREATVVGTDPYSDLAVVRAGDRPDYAEPLALRSTDPPVGTRVLAVGNPFGYEASASAGIVSGVDRSLPGPNDFAIPDAVQTDAAVNPGNSGGPLVALDGGVVGVITATRGDNLGFAVSAPLARRVAPALVETGSYAHPYVGVRLQTVTPSVATANDLDESRGVLVVDVVDGGPADGVLQGSPDSETVHGQTVPVGGDVVRAVDGTPTPTVDALTAELALAASPGDVVAMTVLRDGRRRTLDVELGERPPP